MGTTFTRCDEKAAAPRNAGPTSRKDRQYRHNRQSLPTELMFFGRSRVPAPTIARQLAVRTRAKNAWRSVGNSPVRRWDWRFFLRWISDGLLLSVDGLMDSIEAFGEQAPVLATLGTAEGRCASVPVFRVANAAPHRICWRINGRRRFPTGRPVRARLFAYPGELLETRRSRRTIILRPREHIRRGVSSCLERDHAVASPGNRHAEEAHDERGSPERAPHV